MPRQTRTYFRYKPSAEFSRREGELAEDRVPGSSKEYLRLLFSAAAELMGGEHEGEVRDFVVSVFQLGELLRAFRRSPRGKIGGEGGVAAQLNVSRNAVYLWLDALQLDPDDVRNAADLTELLHKSPVLRQTVEKLLPRGVTCK